ncbi:polyprenyl synthetase family protein [Fodinicola feengrottensis]|uniref:polyprenyl synthetase family protein n=1 Tax=Fodinicola feengrottensis TaxID=435914 RepID=UPI002441A5CB|nr:polyprenyl synthetase family protein [Fodinicola feengrottensis]
MTLGGQVGSTATAVARTLTGPALRSVVDRLQPDLALLCGYHFGWSGPHGESLPDGSVPAGKSTRSALLFAAARGVGGSEEIALPGAVAVELVHNWTLLHDDIIDRDTERRGRETAWSVFGSGLAMLAGDALLSAAYTTLAAARPVSQHALQLLCDAVDRLIAASRGTVAHYPAGRRRG